MLVLGTKMKCEIHQKDEDMIGVPESISMSSKNHDGGDKKHEGNGCKAISEIVVELEHA
jgi:hypothetical protein